MTLPVSERSLALAGSTELNSQARVRASIVKKRAGRALGAALSLMTIVACGNKAPQGGTDVFAGAPGTGMGGVPSGGSGGSSATSGGSISSGGSTPLTIPSSNPNSGGVGGSGANMGTAGTPPKMVTQECASKQTSSTDVTSVQPADIIFAIDTSSSMTQEIVFTQTYMNDFSQMIVDSGIDVRVIVIAGPRTGGGMIGGGGRAGTAGGAGVAGAAGGGGRGGVVLPGAGQTVCIDAPLGSGQCPADTKLPNYVHIEQYVDSNNALQVIIDQYPMYKQYLRPNASKAFVVISDDNASKNAQTFTADIAALEPGNPAMFANWTFNGVYCFTRCGNLAAAVGTVFQELVTQTKGVGGDLCEQDFQPVFKRLAEQIIVNSGSKIACEWDFPPPPAGQSFSTELVDVQRTGKAGMVKLTRVKSVNECVPGGWHYDDLVNPKKIVACPATCTDLQNDTGGKIDVIFACEQVGGCAASSVGVGVGATALSCDWELPDPPTGTQLDFANVNVRFTNEAGFATTLGKVNTADECAMFDLGWHYDNPTTPSRILACPDTCEKLKQGGAMSKIDVLLGCQTIAAPPK